MRLITILLALSLAGCWIHDDATQERDERRLDRYFALLGQCRRATGYKPGLAYLESAEAMTDGRLEREHYLKCVTPQRATNREGGGREE